MKQRLVIEQGPIPLYCSDECKVADLHTHRRDAPHDPAREEAGSESPIPCTPSSDTTDSSDVSSSASSSSVPPPPSPPKSSLDKFVAMYNLPPLPPVMPTIEDEPERPPPPEYNSGIMMAGRLINSLCPPPAKPHTGKYRPVQEARKPIPGWTDGSNAWRAAVYSTGKPKDTLKDPFQEHRSSSSVPPTRFTSTYVASRRNPTARKASSSVSLSLASAPATFHSSSAMISKFSENFIRRSESRVSLYTNSGTATPSSPVSSHSLPSSSPRRERHLVHPDAKGKLLVPDVKMKMSSSCSSSCSLSSAWSGPSTTASSRRSVRSPLSATSDSDEDTERCISSMSLPKRPVENTRSWSYDNVKTYDMMPMPVKQKLVKKMEKKVVDGEEVEVEVEVEVYEKRKRLFLFAPTRISESQ